jgi:hypothetical protein
VDSFELRKLNDFQAKALQHEPEDLILLKTYFDTFNTMLFDGVLVPTRCPNDSSIATSAQMARIHRQAL